MDAGLSLTAKSVLDKPLYLLTDDDISQLTREDCRRYLKQKGMRRPSWNKSQAIQQVISLKSLLEPSPPPQKEPPSEIPAPPRVSTTSTVNSNSSGSVKESSVADGETPVSALADLDLPASSDPVREMGCCQLDINNKSMPVSGKINVYNRVPCDQAQALMHLAATPIQFLQDQPSGNSSPWATPGHLPSLGTQSNMFPADRVLSQPLVSGKMTELIQHCRREGSSELEVEGQTNRQVSLQRYLEKRKDRGRFKGSKRGGSSSSGLEAYLNHQMSSQTVNGQKTRVCTTSPSLASCSSMDDRLKNPALSFDLNDKV